jgi:hypothetical protein
MASSLAQLSPWALAHWWQMTYHSKLLTSTGEWRAVPALLGGHMAYASACSSLLLVSVLAMMSTVSIVQLRPIAALVMHSVAEAAAAHSASMYRYILGLVHQAVIEHNHIRKSSLPEHCNKKEPKRMLVLQTASMPSSDWRSVTCFKFVNCERSSCRRC